MFTLEESQYIINALDQEIRRTGLQTAAFALGIVAKLQNAARSQNEAEQPVKDEQSVEASGKKEKRKKD